MYRLAIMTVSTSGYTGYREDTGSEAISEVLSQPDYETVEYCIVDDDKDMISRHMAVWADRDYIDILVSTVGTGLGPRDVTPEAWFFIKSFLDARLAECIRSAKLEFYAMGVCSR